MDSHLTYYRVEARDAKGEIVASSDVFPFPAKYPVFIAAIEQCISKGDHYRSDDGSGEVRSTHPWTWRVHYQWELESDEDLRSTSPDCQFIGEMDGKARFVLQHAVDVPPFAHLVANYMMSYEGNRGYVSSN